VTNSNITNSYVEDAYVDNSTVINSFILNSSITDAIVIDANITNGIIYNGTISSGGVTYNATQNGSAPIADVVNFPPTANLIFGSSAYIGHAVMFNGSSSSDPNIPGRIGDSLTYFFNFGDGTNYTGTLTEISHNYTSAGVYTASLTVIDSFGLSDNASGSVTIIAEPAPPSTGRGGSYWRRTYRITDEQFENGYTIDLRVKDRVQFSANNENHYAGVVRLSGDTVSLEVWSAVQTATLSPGELSEFDVTGNASADLYIKIISISNSMARVYIKKGEFTAPVIAAPVIVAPVITQIEERKVTIAPETAGIATWLIVLIAALLILIAAVVMYKFSSRAKARRTEKENVEYEAERLLKKAGVGAEEEINVRQSRPVMERIYEYNDGSEEKKASRKKSASKRKR